MQLYLLVMAAFFLCHFVINLLKNIDLIIEVYVF